MGAFLSRGMLLTIAGCGAVGIGVTVGTSLLIGIWIGRMVVSFPQGSTANRLSDGSGQARVKIQADAAQNPEIASYAGILPAFLELGTTHANVDLDSGAVTGTVTEPSSATHDLSEVLPGLKASRDSKTREASQTSGPGARSFTLQFTSGDTTYIYQVSFTLQADASGATLTGEVTVRRQTIQNGVVILNETGTGSLTASPATESAFNEALPPASPPILVDAGPNIAIDAGASVQLPASATGGSGALTYAWTPTTDLDDPSVLQPIASPSVTTVYSFVVTDAEGQQAHDEATVIVSETPLGTSAIVVEAGEDQSVVLGASVKLAAEASGGVGALTYSWEPTTGLDDPTLLQPTASPAATTTYRLTVTDSQGRQAHDEVAVAVMAPPSNDALNIEAYYNGSLYRTLDLTSNSVDVVIYAGNVPSSVGDFFGIFVSAGPDASYTAINLTLVFDNPSDATGSMSATDVKGYIQMGYMEWDSANPHNLAGVYDNSDIYVPMGPTPLFTPVGTVDLCNTNGRIVGTFDVTVTQQLTDSSPVNTMRWVGSIDLPDTWKLIGGLVTTGL
jgi:hypothetical protein